VFLFETVLIFWNEEDIGLPELLFSAYPGWRADYC